MKPGAPMLTSAFRPVAARLHLPIAARAVFCPWSRVRPWWASGTSNARKCFSELNFDSYVASRSGAATATFAASRGQGQRQPPTSTVSV